MPAPVLYPGHRSLRKDSMTVSVATPTCVAPPAISSSTERITPRVALRPSAATSLGRPMWWRKSSYVPSIR